MKATRHIENRTAIQSFPHGKKRTVIVEVRPIDRGAKSQESSHKNADKPIKKPKMAEKKRSRRKLKKEKRKKVIQKFIGSTSDNVSQKSGINQKRPTMKSLAINKLKRRVKLRDSDIGRAGLPEEEDRDPPTVRRSTSVTLYSEFLKRIR